MAQTRFTGPVVSDNGFVGSFTGGDTNLTLSGTLEVTGATTLNGGLTMDTNKFTVANTTGNTAIGGTLNVTGLSTLAALTASGATTFSNATVKMTALPTADPVVAGALWNDGGTVKVSAGA